MGLRLERREFLQTVAAAGVAPLIGARLAGAAPRSKGSPIISPGCRGTKVRVGKIYIGGKGLWPTPLLDMEAEVKAYEARFAKMKKDFADVEFVCNQLVTTPAAAKALRDKLADTDGILAIHLSMGTQEIRNEILAAGKPTIIFAVPYSGHEWTGLGALRKTKQGALLECMLTSDYGQLAAAVRPFRAIHHMREAKILNVTSRALSEPYLNAIKEKFGTEIKAVSRERVLAAYNSVPDGEAKALTKRMMRAATKIVEPEEDEIFKSCKLALAFKQILDEDNGTMITVDCYGTMYRQLPAFPCVGNTLMDDIGLGGVCESDLRCAMTYALLQGLIGRPCFVSDPTVDESKKSIILAHCRCATKMDGPEGKAAPYKLRTIMERQEGCVQQVKMRVGQRVTQAILVGPDKDGFKLPYFTGEIIEAPDVDRGCRSKINVRVDGDITKLWNNWSQGLHRQTVYGDVVDDLKRFCRFKSVEMINEAV